ncbi:hypothetical protein MMC25_007484 [Agyrium rufum]|nr:hypothetical protein [Agyrium rufum]
MAARPNDEDVTTLAGIICVGPNEAARWLSSYNGIEAAVEAYYTNPNALAQQEVSSYKYPGFAIHAQDTLNPNIFDPGFSRPPSRVSNRGATPVGGQSNQLSVAEQEDADMKQAMAMSMSQTLPTEQETGVTDSSGAHFAPATKSHYDPSTWGMTVTGARTTEIFQNPDPEYRRREAGRPAFIKPAISRDYLPALITILHAIPLTREALLLRESIAPDYGENQDWWDGMAIDMPITIRLDEDSPTQEIKDFEVVREAQRLMAFLDDTERAYGSSEALANQEYIHRETDSLPTFLELWRLQAGLLQNDSEYEGPFLSQAMMDGQPKPFEILELSDYSNILTRQSYTLYDCLDDNLWNPYTVEEGSRVFFTACADVLIMRIPGKGQYPHDQGVKVPAIFYPDRYLEDNVESTKEMRVAKAKLIKTIKDVGTSISQLCNFAHPDGKEYDAGQLLQVVQSYLRPETLDNEGELAPADLERVEEVQSDSERRKSDLAGQLEEVVSRVGSKIQELERSRDDALEQMRELSKLLTHPSGSDDEAPKHRYTLRGVSADYRTIYVLTKTDLNISDDLLSYEAADAEQWWKITYSIGESNPITYTRVREVEALKAARDEGPSALLIYASDRAMSCPQQPLPSELKNFVRTDNLHFTADLERSHSSRPFSQAQFKRKASYDNDQAWPTEIRNRSRSQGNNANTDYEDATNFSNFEDSLPLDSSPSSHQKTYLVNSSSSDSGVGGMGDQRLREWGLSDQTSYSADSKATHIEMADPGQGMTSIDLRDSSDSSPPPSSQRFASARRPNLREPDKLIMIHDDYNDHDLVQNSSKPATVKGGNVRDGSGENDAMLIDIADDDDEEEEDDDDDDNGSSGFSDTYGIGAKKSGDRGVSGIHGVGAKQDVEMEETGKGGAFGDPGVKGKEYKLGSYVPELDMDDDSDNVEEVRKGG